MKNLSIFVLMALAAATVAFGQFGVADAAKVNVACPDDECHVAPYFAGEGGFVGEVADGFDEANLVVTCGNVSTTASAKPDANGIVAMLFNMDNGLACDGNGSVEIHGLMDGGWYWITDDMNSAVSGLMPKDAMGNAQTSPADPGSDDIKLETVEGGFATFVKQMSTGRVGIIPHVLPEPPAPDALDCGLYVDGNAYKTRANGCMLDASLAIKVTTADNAGRSDAVTIGDMVYRRATGDVVLTARLFGSGHIVTGGTNAALGYDVAYGGGGNAASRAPLRAMWDVNRTDAAPGTSTLEDVNISADVAGGGDTSSIMVTISPLASCASASSAGLAQSFRIDAVTPSERNDILPGVPGNHRNSTIAMINKTITVVCPGSSSSQGQELVPDNPFPTDE